MFPVISTNRPPKRYKTRCRVCREESFQGKPCNVATCLCRCHRVNLKKEAASKRDLAFIRSQPGMENWTVPKSFDEELAEGKFGAQGPKRIK